MQHYQRDLVEGALKGPCYYLSRTGEQCERLSPLYKFTLPKDRIVQHYVCSKHIKSLLVESLGKCEGSYRKELDKRVVLAPCAFEGRLTADGRYFCWRHRRPELRDHSDTEKIKICKTRFEDYRKKIADEKAAAIVTEAPKEESIIEGAQEIVLPMGTDLVRDKLPVSIDEEPKVKIATVVIENQPPVIEANKEKPKRKPRTRKPKKEVIHPTLEKVEVDPSPDIADPECTTGIKSPDAPRVSPVQSPSVDKAIELNEECRPCTTTVEQVQEALKAISINKD